MDWTFLKNLFSTPGERTLLADGRAGKAVFVGTVKAGHEALRSPIEGAACVAFYYRSTWKAPSRGGTIARLVEEAQVYAPDFLLELEDADLRVVPRESGTFSRADHQRLLGAALPGFDAAEQLVRAHDRVRLHGRLSLGESGPWLDLTRVEILESAAAQASQGKDDPRPQKPRGRAGRSQVRKKKPRK